MKKQNTFDKIDNARKVLELSETATMEEIKANYKKLVLQWHPDKCRHDKEVCEEMTKKINHAYEVIVDYCNHYEFSFSKEEIEKYVTEKEWWSMRFGKDPVWGTYNGED